MVIWDLNWGQAEVFWIVLSASFVAEPWVLGSYCHKDMKYLIQVKTSDLWLLIICYKCPFGSIGHCHSFCSSAAHIVPCITWHVFSTYSSIIFHSAISVKYSLLYFLYSNSCHSQLINAICHFTHTHKCQCSPYYCLTIECSQVYKSCCTSQESYSSQTIYTPGVKVDNILHSWVYYII